MDLNCLETLIKNYAKSNAISSFINIKKENAVPKGENYASTISRITANVVLTSGQKRIRNIILKEIMLTPDMTQAQVSSKIAVFKTETWMYQTVLIQMENIMYEFNDTSDKLWGDMVGFNPYSSIALNDLTLEGFKVSERRNMLDLNHGLLVVRSLAKFHALSKILLERGIIGKDDLGNFWPGKNSETVKYFLQGALRQLSKTMINSWPSKWKHIGLKIQAQVSEVVNRLQLIVPLVDDGFHVANHGDPWTCNMMFKHEPITNTPIGLKFLDFQTCHYNSFIFDLIHFVYSSIIPEIRRKNIDNLIKAYHESLEYYLKLYDFQGKIPDLNDIKAEHHRAQYWSFMVIAMVLPLTSADTTEAFDAKKLIPAPGKEQEDFLHPVVLESKILIDRIGPDLEMFEKNNLI